MARLRASRAFHPRVARQSRSHSVRSRLQGFPKRASGPLSVPKSSGPRTVDPHCEFLRSLRSSFPTPVRPRRLGGHTRAWISPGRRTGSFPRCLGAHHPLATRRLPMASGPRVDRTKTSGRGTGFGPHPAGKSHRMGSVQDRTCPSSGTLSNLPGSVGFRRGLRSLGIPGVLLLGGPGSDPLFHPGRALQALGSTPPQAGVDPRFRTSSRPPRGFGTPGDPQRRGSFRKHTDPMRLAGPAGSSCRLARQDPSEVDHQSKGVEQDTHAVPGQFPGPGGQQRLVWPGLLERTMVGTTDLRASVGQRREGPARIPVRSARGGTCGEPGLRSFGSSPRSISSC